MLPVQRLCEHCVATNAKALIDRPNSREYGDIVGLSKGADGLSLIQLGAVRCVSFQSTSVSLQPHSTPDLTALSMIPLTTHFLVAQSTQSTKMSGAELGLAVVATVDGCIK